MDSVKAELPAKLGFFLEPMRYKVAYGGRGSSKSWSLARAIIIRMKTKKTRVLCARELQTSITESVHKLLSDQIEILGFGMDFSVQNNRIIGRNGSEAIFSGIRNNPTKIKSTEGIDIAWVEEAEKVSSTSWEILIPTIRKPDSEIWVSFNPHDEKDPTYQRFVVKPPPECVSVKIDWQDNPWFPDELRREKDYLYSVDPAAAEHVWGGQCRQLSDAQVLRGKYVVEGFEVGENWDGPYYGADWGFSSDPTTLLKCWISDDVLYIEREIYGVGIETDHMPDFFGKIEGSKNFTIRADNARPEMISHMRRHGFSKIEPVEKWAGSVEDGISKLRSFRRIVIHPRCKHTADEARLWSYKTDRLTGDVLPDLIDKHNHCWDAIRYALQPLIRRRQSITSSYVGI